jgi:predicted neuraminidase
MQTINEREKGFVFTQGPTIPFPSCHASTIARASDGTLVCAWFGGTHEKHPDVGIWLSRRGIGQQKWSRPVLVAKITPVAHWNPVLFVMPDNTLHLWFKVGATIPNWITWTMVSEDNGVTWGGLRELVEDDTDGGRGPVKNKPILLSDGTILAGASTEQGTWEAFVDRSEDGGATWERTPNIDRTALGAEHGCIQPTLWESSPGYTHAFVRSSCGYLPRTDSIDNGKTWSPLHQTDIPNNNSGVDIARLEDGTLALVLNPVSEDWGKRSPLSLWVSRDNGATWPEKWDIANGVGGEFSYPAIVAHGQEVFVTYTHERTQIAFWHGEISLI